MCKNEFIIKTTKFTKSFFSYLIITLVTNSHRSTFIETKQADEIPSDNKLTNKDKECGIENENQSVSATTSSSTFINSIAIRNGKKNN
jgi:hypothetical protein